MKNSKQLIREIAKQQGMPEKEVTEIYNFLMHNFKTQMTGVRSPGIAIYGIGNFVADHRKLRKYLAGIISKVRFYKYSEKSKNVSAIKKAAYLVYYEDVLKTMLIARNELAIHNVKLKGYYAKKRLERDLRKKQDASPCDQKTEVTTGN